MISVAAADNQSNMSSLITPNLADWLDPPPPPDLSEWTTKKRHGFLWSKQREIAKSIEEHRFTAVQSCHGTGKSFLAADLVAWWLDIHPIGDAFAVTTAPTAPQVEAILWREISVAHDQAKLRGRITWGQVPMWKIGDRMIAYGRKPADYSDPNKAMQAFQGIHAKYVLVVLDEACGIPVWLWNAVDSIVTNDDSRVLAIGNPDDPSSEFYKVCSPGSGYNVIRVSAYDLPWATGEAVPDGLNKSLTGKGWVEERKKKWGVNSPLYQSKVLGEFPDLSDDSLITPRMVREAQERELAGIELGCFGADVARFGVDLSTVYRDRGGVIRKVGEWSKQDTMTTAGKFKRILDEKGNSIPMHVDLIGVGAGVYDRLRELEANVIPFDAGASAYDPLRFRNRRSECYWELREDFEAQLIDLDPEDDELANELISIKWSVDSRGRVYVESKDDMKKRGMPSPNRADAVMMSRQRGGYVPAPDDMPQNEDLTSDLLQRKM
jgi:hypothetical protein